MKVILNKCYGGFSVSDAGYRLYAKKKGINIFAYVAKYRKDGKTDFYRVDDVGEGRGLLGLTFYFKKDFGKAVSESELDFREGLFLREEQRNDPVLVEVVEELGSAANGACANLRVVDIPDGMDYVIDEYDGIETLHERVREW